MWYFFAKLDDIYPDTWVVRYNYVDSSIWELYVASFYFTITTITTVGYGDISGGTTLERIICIILMCIGGILYSFAIGSLSSILSSLDSSKAKLNEKINTLNQLKTAYKIPFELYYKLRSAIRYDHSSTANNQSAFLSELPNNLQVELSVVMHRDIINIQFFEKRSKYFIAFIGPLLRSLTVPAGEIIYSEGEPITDIYFLKKGQVGFILKRKEGNI